MLDFIANDFIANVVDAILFPALGFLLGLVLGWIFFGRLERERGRSDARDALTAAQRELEALQVKLSGVEARLVGDKGAAPHLKKELQEARESVAELEDRLAASVERARALEEQLVGSEETLDQRDLTIQELREKLARLEGMPSKSAEQERAARDAEARLARACEERDAATERCRSLEERIARGEEALAELHRELAEMEQLADNATRGGADSARDHAARLHALEEKLAASDAECARWQARAGALEAAETSRGSDRLEALEGELDRSRRALEEKEALITRFRAQLEAAAAMPPPASVAREDVDATAPRERPKKRRAEPSPRAQKASLNGGSTPRARSTGRTAPPEPLRRISGITPALEKKLHKAGVRTLAQIAGWQSADIDAVAGRIGMPASRIKSEQWVASARRLVTRARPGK